MQSALALVPDGDLATRAPLLLELGEQQLLAADLVRARRAFRTACAASNLVESTKSQNTTIATPPMNYILPDHPPDAHPTPTTRR